MGWSPPGQPSVPDIVQYANTRAAGHGLPPASVAQHLRILEVCYTDERSVVDARAAKLVKYESTLANLREHGHTVRMSVLALGTRVPTARDEWEGAWTPLGVPADRHERLHAAIWASSLRYLRSQVVAWRIAAPRTPPPREGVG